MFVFNPDYAADFLDSLSETLNFGHQLFVFRNVSLFLPLLIAAHLGSQLVFDIKKLVLKRLNFFKNILIGPNWRGVKWVGTGTIGVDRIGDMLLFFLKQL